MSEQRKVEWPPAGALAGGASDASGEGQAEAAIAGIAAAAGLLIGSIVRGEAARLADRLLAHLGSADTEVPWDVVVPGVVLVASQRGERICAAVDAETPGRRQPGMWMVPFGLTDGPW